MGKRGRTHETHTVLSGHFLSFMKKEVMIKVDLSGNTVWPPASGFQKLAKIDLLSTHVNVARFARDWMRLFRWISNTVLSMVVNSEGWIWKGRNCVVNKKFYCWSCWGMTFHCGGPLGKRLALQRVYIVAVDFVAVVVGMRTKSRPVYRCLP